MRRLRIAAQNLGALVYGRISLAGFTADEVSEVERLARAAVAGDLKGDATVTAGADVNYRGEHIGISPQTPATRGCVT